MHSLLRSRDKCHSLIMKLKLIQDDILFLKSQDKEIDLNDYTGIVNEVNDVLFDINGDWINDTTSKVEAANFILYKSNKQVIISTINGDIVIPLVDTKMSQLQCYSWRDKLHVGVSA